jgi:L-tartrate/succinate antiporter
LDISWARWSLGVLPVGLILLGTLPLLVYTIYPPEVRRSREVPAWAAGELARMGRISAREWAMVALIGLTFALWIFGRGRIDPTAVGLIAVCLMLALDLISWDDLAGDKVVWGVLIYFATMITLSDGLHRVGVIAWASGAIAAPLGSVPPTVALVLLVTAFYAAHYLFASLTAHTTALLPVVLAAGSAIEGMPVRALALLAAYSIGLMGVLTPYATGPAPVYYGSGFLPRRDFWLLGLAFGSIFLAVLLAVGLPILLAVGA